MTIWVLLLLLLGMVAAAIILARQLIRLIALDAAARELPHPRLTSILAAGSQNGAGLLAYLVWRRQHPIISGRDNLSQRRRLKKRAIAALSLLATLAICVGVVLLFGTP